jgi:lysophospholipid acyltransferase (LPLAT)-like uncharacterized protein
MWKLLKRELVKSAAVQYLTALIAYLYIEFVYFTTRWQTYGCDAVEPYWDAGKPMIVCFWHNRLLVMPRCWRRGVKAKMLISHHRDGKLISAVIAHFGVGTVSGSTSRGSAAALREMMDAIDAGYSIGFTPDGPRGPRYQAAIGAIYLAKVTGLPIVGVSVATSRRKVLRSWDRFLICFPFSRGAFVWGKPMSVPADAGDATMEQLRQKLQSEMIEITNRSDFLVGQQPIPLHD